jgi:hypothetical protein
MLYVIQDDHGRSKIGISTDPKGRLAQLQTGSPRPLSLAAIYAPDCDSLGALRIEDAAKAMLANHRSGGGDEWFDVEPALVSAAISANAMQRGVKLCQIDAATAAKATAILASQPLLAGPARRLSSETVVLIGCALFGVLVAVVFWISVAP